MVAVFDTKKLDEITPKLLRMRLRLIRYSYDIRYIPGKQLGAAAILSRRPLLQYKDDDDLEEHITPYVKGVTTGLPASDERLCQIILKQQNDLICQKLIEYSKTGWPTRKRTPLDLQEYWQHQGEIALSEGILLKVSRILIPGAVRRDILRKLHDGHQGITKCRARARESVWWSGLSRNIETLIMECSQCIQESGNHHESLMPAEFPERPWQKVTMDLFHLSDKWFLLVTDCYSRYPEVAALSSLRETEVITHLKSVFARHGTSEIVYSDNGTHFGPMLTSKFAQFAKKWEFRHVTTSPRFPQSNGFVEAAVKIIKRSLKKSDDAYKALQNYRATPTPNGFSPAELLTGRRIRTAVPIIRVKLDPQIPDVKLIREREEKRRDVQKSNYDRHHGVRELTELEPGDSVWIVDRRVSGTIVRRDSTSRSYIVPTGTRELRRNRFHLIPLAKEPEDDDEDIWPEHDDQGQQTAPAAESGDNYPTSSSTQARERTTRSERISRPPNKLDL